MKKILFLFSALALLTSCGDEAVEKKGNTTIKGTLTNTAGETIYLIDVNSQTFMTLDTAVLDEKGNFEFAANLNETGVFNIKITDQNFATIILSPNDKAEIKGDAKNISNTWTISGSEQGKLYYDINTFMKQNGYRKADLKRSIDSLQGYFSALIEKRKDQPYIDSLNKAFMPTFSELQNKMGVSLSEGQLYGKKFIEENPKAFATIIALNLINPETDFGYYQKVDGNLRSAYPNSANLKPFHSWVAEKTDEYTKLAIGTPAPEFTVKDLSGKDISLASFKGKIVLVDFWASWCAPCRKENPNVVAAYMKYKDKGLEIFGVSLDSEKPKWSAAVKEDGLNWKHGSELQGWKSSFVPMYSIKGIPFNVLVGKNGEVLAKDLSGPKLFKALDEAFAKQ